ncbi:twin-arginine translocase subunit TatC [Candidatus Saccharibacteria bacterium]|nr:twin-arginine translocase subunit TatC [Candidatus Saccharibacteria bacterium]
MTKKPTQSNRPAETTKKLPTFLDHLNELKSRLFWVALAFIVAAGAAYPFYQQIIHAIVAPLGDQTLYYTTPAGGLSLIIKVCMFAGLIGMLPVLIYHLYRFVSPIMQKKSARSLVIYTFSSVILAALGIAFAYFVSLPASLYFLTGIEVAEVNPLLTLDAYLSFTSAYIIAGALLFQLPLVMLIINSVSHLTPKKLMSYQRYLIVGAFIVAAIITPTPDAVNQTLLAAPIVIMYQIGIVIIWLKNRRSRPKLASRQQTSSQLISSDKKPQLRKQLTKPVLSTKTMSPSLRQPSLSQSLKNPTMMRPTHIQPKKSLSVLAPKNQLSEFSAKTKMIRPNTVINQNKPRLKPSPVAQSKVNTPKPAVFMEVKKPVIARNSNLVSTPISKAPSINRQMINPSMVNRQVERSLSQMSRSIDQSRRTVAIGSRGSFNLEARARAI